MRSAMFVFAVESAAAVVETTVAFDVTAEVADVKVDCATAKDDCAADTPEFVARAEVNVDCAAVTRLVAEVAVLTRPEVSAVAEFEATKAVDCVVDATTKRLEAAVVADVAVVTAVDSTDWFAKAVASAVDNVASNAVFAAELRARIEAAVDAAVEVAVTAETFVDVCVLTLVVV